MPWVRTRSSVTRNGFAINSLECITGISERHYHCKFWTNLDVPSSQLRIDCKNNRLKIRCRCSGHEYDPNYEYVVKLPIAWFDDVKVTLISGQFHVRAKYNNSRVLRSLSFSDDFIA